ncbi:hypothetical protein KL921_004785 [Ogataea angusta]|nr:hypothetical protein KL921_004785 [Ogataea angusta]
MEKHGVSRDLQRLVGAAEIEKAEPFYLLTKIHIVRCGSSGTARNERSWDSSSLKDRQTVAPKDASAECIEKRISPCMCATPLHKLSEGYLKYTKRSDDCLKEKFFRSKRTIDRLKIFNSSCCRDRQDICSSTQAQHWDGFNKRDKSVHTTCNEQTLHRSQPPTNVKAPLCVRFSGPHAANPVEGKTRSLQPTTETRYLVVRLKPVEARGLLFCGFTRMRMHIPCAWSRAQQNCMETSQI